MARRNSGRLVVELPLAEGKPSRGVRLGEVGIELDRLPARLLGLREVFLGALVVAPELGVGVGQTRPRQRVAGIDFDRLGEHLPRRFEIRTGSATVMAAAPQVELVGLEIGRAFGAQGLFLDRAQGQLQGLDDVVGNLALDDEDIGELTVIGLRPQVETVGHLDQLGADTELIARLAHAALENIVDPEPAADLLYIEVGLLERVDRGPRRDAKTLDVGEGADQLFGQTVGEVLVVGIGAQIGKRQHRHRRHVVPGCGCDVCREAAGSPITGCGRLFGAAAQPPAGGEDHDRGEPRGGPQPVLAESPSTCGAAEMGVAPLPVVNHPRVDLAPQALELVADILGRLIARLGVLLQTVLDDAREVPRQRFR